MRALDEIKITVVNWEKYQPKSDRLRHPHWFRMNRDCGLSSGLSGLSAEQCWVWVQTLSECCRKNSGAVSVRLTHLSRVSGVSEKVVWNTFEILSKNNTVTVECEETVQPTDSLLIPHNITEHNKTEQNITNTFSVEPKIGSPATAGLLGSLSLESRKKLNSLYPDTDFVVREVTKMEIWLGANKNKNPKSPSGWSRFVMGWLERGWEQYRKSLQSKPVQKDWKELLKEQEQKHGPR